MGNMVVPTLAEIIMAAPTKNPKTQQHQEEEVGNYSVQTAAEGGGGEEEYGTGWLRVVFALTVLSSIGARATDLIFTCCYCMMHAACCSLC